MNFQQAAESFINGLETPRRRGVLSANTRRLYTAYARRAVRTLGSVDMREVRNGRVRSFVEELRNEKLADSTISGHLVVLKLVVSSIKTQDGEQVYNSNFDNEYIVAPVVHPEEQPCATREDVERGDTLVKLLAATGLRIGEIANAAYNAECAVIHIAKGKTSSARRDVYLTAEFNEWLKPRWNTFRPNRTLYDVLDRASLPSPHAFRRFRITHLRKAGMNESVLRRQVGHSNPGITSRYDRSGADETFARAEVQRVGVGFSF